MEQSSRVWAIVTSVAGKRIGAVTQDKLVDGSRWVTLNPCYEYVSELQFAHNHEGQPQIVGRMQVIIPYDHTMEPFPVEVLAAEVAYVKDMGASEARAYTQKLEDTVRKAAEERARRNSGLILATEMPSAPRRA
jgi:hypothetical protein